MNYDGPSIHHGVIVNILRGFHENGQEYVTTGELMDAYLKTPLPGPIRHMGERSMATVLKNMGDADDIDRYIVSNGSAGRTSYMRLKSPHVTTTKPSHPILAGSVLSGKVVSAARRSIAEKDPERGLGEILEIVGAK